MPLRRYIIEVGQLDLSAEIRSSTSSPAVKKLLQKRTTPVSKVAPYNDDREAQRAWRAYIQQLTELLAADRRGDAVALFMKYVGMPAEQIEAMRHAPTWPMFETIAPTLAR